MASAASQFRVGSKLLYCGDLSVGSTAEMRCRALESLGFTVTAVPSNAPAPLGVAGRAVDRVFAKLRCPIDWAKANRSLIALAESHDLVWIDKGLTISRSTLERLARKNPEAPIVGYSPDNMALRQYNSRRFLQALPGYTGFITTKSFGVSDLRRMGARRVVFSQNGFDPATHAPACRSNPSAIPQDIDVGFIGYFEPERAASILALCRAGIRVAVFGQQWCQLPRPLPGTLSVHAPVFGREYVRTLHRFKIALCFLRKLAGDVQTTRSVEIPACGVFMLAERSAEHEAMFAEGTETDFFATTSELIEKTRRYLRDDQLRERMAQAALARVHEGRYSYGWRLHDALVHLDLRPPSPPSHPVGFQTRP